MNQMIIKYNGKTITAAEEKKLRLDWMEAEDLRNSRRAEAEEAERNRIFDDYIDGMESTVRTEGGPPFPPDELEELVKSLTRDVARLFLKLQDKERGR